jgi:dedicator of cytokinesis protein 3
MNEKFLKKLIIISIKFLQKLGTMRHKTPKKPNFTQNHLYFCMRDFSHRIGDDAEIYFYLYDGNAQRALSERFLVKISKGGFSNYVKTLHSNCTVFCDLGENELKTDLYLVANIMRCGKLLPNENRARQDQQYRRPFGIGVLPLNDYANTDRTVEPEEKEHSFKVYMVENEKDYYQLHEFIIRKANAKYAVVSGQNNGQNCSLVVSLKLLNGGLGQAKHEQPTLFQGTTITRKMGFPDVIFPGDYRNDLFLSLVSGEFDRGGKTTGKNVEISVSIHESSGQILSGCLYPASGSEASDNYRSMILYHNNTPSWNETLRLCVPIEKFGNAHVRFEFRHCSTSKPEPKIFGFSFVRLMQLDGSAMADGTHDLFIYKCEDRSKLTSAAYLKLPSLIDDDQAITDGLTMTAFSRNSKETFQIKSMLCSTKLTQNSDLLALLQWKNHPEKIQDSLTRVLRLNDEELVKFLQDVLDALFAMFSTVSVNTEK